MHDCAYFVMYAIVHAYYHTIHYTLSVIHMIYTKYNTQYIYYVQSVIYIYKYYTPLLYNLLYTILCKYLIIYPTLLNTILYPILYIPYTHYTHIGLRIYQIQRWSYEDEVGRYWNRGLRSYLRNETNFYAFEGICSVFYELCIAEYSIESNCY